MTLVAPGGQVTPAGVIPRLKQFTVSGIFEVGMFEYDSGLALIQLEDAQKLFQMGDAVSGLRLRLDDLFAARSVARELMAKLDRDTFATDWTRSHANFFRAVEIEKRVMFIILLLIVAVAAFNIVSTLVMAVTDKRADIAILRTLGASPRSVMGIFVVQGATSGIIGTLGGVAEKTREAMLVCEAAGFDIVIVETVGVGQSETAVAGMTDLFLLLLVPGGGDELQGIKRGVMEIADAIVVNKAEGDNRPRAELARQQCVNALHMLAPKSPHWQVPVLLCSALQREGIGEVWDTIQAFRVAMQHHGEFAAKRALQNSDWMWTLLMDDLKETFLRHPKVEALLPQLQQSVAAGVTTPGAAARRLLEMFRRGQG